MYAIRSYYGHAERRGIADFGKDIDVKALRLALQIHFATHDDTRRRAVDLQLIRTSYNFV